MKEKINNYFDGKIRRNQEQAAWYSEKARSEKFDTPRRQFEDQSWLHGVKMPALLNDMRKDILRLA